jgi:hypothetical protein
MKTKTVQVYDITELQESARQKAYENWFRVDNYAWERDNNKTLSEFENIFKVKVTDWEYGYRKFVRYKLNIDEDVENLKGVRLLRYLINNCWKYLYKGKFYSTKGKYINGKYTYKHRRSKVMFNNDCVLTGYIADYEILSPIYEFLKKPSNDISYNDLIRKCLDSWLDYCHKDYEASLTEEYFIETCEANEWQFMENGDMCNF